MKNLKVSTRLFGGFGMLLALLCAIAVLESYNTRILRDGMIDIVEVNNEQARLAAEMRAAVTDRAVAVRNIAAARSQGHRLRGAAAEDSGADLPRGLRQAGTDAHVQSHHAA